MTGETEIEQRVDIGLRIMNSPLVRVQCRIDEDPEGRIAYISMSDSRETDEDGDISLERQ